jgi:transcriptional regulator with XRE-family HTH domain
MLNRKVGQRLKTARKAKGLSLERLAERIEPATNYQTLQKLESGERPITMEWIERIAAGLGMEPMELLTGNEVPSREGLTPQVANELGRTLAGLALGKEPTPGTVAVLSEALLEITATFLAHPAAYRDANIARPVVEMAGRRAAQRAL